MTPQEIDRIENAIRHIQTSTDIDPWAAEIAVEAMRKQIPQRPVIGYAFSDKLREVMKRTDPEKAETKTDCCPVCGRTLGVSKFVQTQSGLRFGDPHCKRCGQAIDWEDVRDDEHIADVSKKVERASETAQNVRDGDRKKINDDKV